MRKSSGLKLSFVIPAYNEELYLPKCLDSMVREIACTGRNAEIIVHGKTGFVARTGDPSDWSKKIEHMLDLISDAPHLYRKMREDARAHVTAHYDWDDSPDSIFEPFIPPAAGEEKKIA